VADHIRLAEYEQKLAEERAMEAKLDQILDI
jgi:hypothetical protein